MTDEEKKIANDSFLKEYGELVQKHKIDIIAYPIWQPDGEGSWKTIIQTSVVSTKDQPVKSPFVPHA